jgi:hypothetical protein
MLCLLKAIFCYFSNVGKLNLTGIVIERLNRRFSLDSICLCAFYNDDMAQSVGFKSLGTEHARDKARYKRKKNAEQSLYFR